MEAVRNLDAILAVEGVDAIFIGPADLSASMGLFPEITHPDVQKTIQDIFDRASAAGKPVGYYCNSGQEARRLAQRGYKLLSVCNDLSILSRSLRRALKDARGDSTPDEPELVMS
jgi:2-keto-3-deoxy-L-rhamnonate aldolase RhmA